MIKGFMQLKNVPAGEVIRFREGDYAVVSEYGYDPSKNKERGNHNSMYISGSGENVVTDGNQWVAVMDMDYIEQMYEPFEGVEYPPDNSSINVLPE